jgi:hypothetical protein
LKSAPQYKSYLLQNPISYLLLYVLELWLAGDHVPHLIVEEDIFVLLWGLGVLEELEGYDGVDQLVAAAHHHQEGRAVVLEGLRGLLLRLDES